MGSKCTKTLHSESHLDIGHSRGFEVKTGISGRAPGVNPKTQERVGNVLTKPGGIYIQCRIPLRTLHFDHKSCHWTTIPSVQAHLSEVLQKISGRLRPNFLNRCGFGANLVRLWRSTTHSGMVLRVSANDHTLTSEEFGGKDRAHCSAKSKVSKQAATAYI